MGVVDAGVQRVRCQGRGVVPVQLDQRPDQIRGRGLGRGVGVRLELMGARPAAHQRGQREGEHRQGQGEQHQGGRRATGLHAQAAEEPVGGRDMAEQGEEGQAARTDHRQALPQVVVVVVAQLMGQHRLHLGRVELVQQGVEEDDPLGRAEAGEVGVAMGRALRPVHHIETRQAEAAAAHQALDALAQGAVLEGLELVEQRGDEARVDQQHQQVEDQPEAPHIEPPALAHGLHQPQHEGDQGQADDGRQQDALEGIGDEQPRGQPVEAEARLQAEAAIDRQGQVHQPRHRGHQGNEDEALRQAAGIEEAGAQIMQRLQPAAQGEAEEEAGGDQQVHHAGADPRHRVIGGLLVGIQPDAVREGPGNLPAVGRHVADLAAGQPQAGQQAGDEGEQEEGGEAAWAHRRGSGEGVERRLASDGRWLQRRIAPLPKSEPIMAERLIA